MILREVMATSTIKMSQFWQCEDGNELLFKSGNSTRKNSRPSGGGCGSGGGHSVEVIVMDG